MVSGKNHCQERVNRVLDYIGEHLDGDLSLARLAEVAAFSPFHFHRIFQAITGETLNTHVRRVRLERAALLLRSSPRRRITDVALEAGFAGSAEFSRAFRNHFGRSPSSWDRRSPLEKSKICKAPDTVPLYSLEELERWAGAATARVLVSRFEAVRYVYIRVFAPYGNQRLLDAYHSLTGWLAQRGTDFRDVVFIGMSLDDPSVTPAENCRYDMGVAFPKPGGGGMLSGILAARGRTGAPEPSESECASREFSIRDLDRQDVAAIHVSGDLGDVGRAWQYLYRLWLPAADFEPADLPAMEVFVQIPEEIGWEKFDLQACIPVVRC